MTEKRRCRAMKADGTPCSLTTHLSDEDLCIWHDPARQAEAKQRQSNGGRKGSIHRGHKIMVADPEDAPAPPQSLEDCVQYASWLINAVTTGVLDARTCKEAVGALRELCSSLEKRDLEKQIDELKAQLKEAKARKGMHAV